jgi:hypothetical protein
MTGRIQNPEGSYVGFSACGMVEITPDNDNDLAKPAYALRLEGVVEGSTLKVKFMDDTIITLNLTEADNGEKPYNVKRVYATGTNVPRIIAIY